MYFTNSRVLILIVSLFFCFGLTGASLNRDIPEGIGESFNKGNSRELSKYFNENIELVVLDNEDVYSKSQAELIMRNFFSVNKPVKFTLLHQGGKELSRYAIGNLEAETGNFRVYCLLRVVDKNILIHLMRLEKVSD